MAVKLIAESGSTKTDWALVGVQSVFWQTQGLNPYYLSAEEIAEVLLKDVFPQAKEATDIYFYGAGCKASDRQGIVREAFKQVFGRNAQVGTDMLGAAVALFGNKEGVACILGTGANACHLSQGKIIADMPSNGIWLGDEGSGGHLGKLLVIAYLNEELPAALRQALEAYTPDRRDDILRKVYREPMPNAYLASFAPFLALQAEHEWVAQLLSQAFDSFFVQLCRHLPRAKHLPIGFVGSIAQHFAQPLHEAATRQGLRIDQMLARPIEALAGQVKF